VLSELYHKMSSKGHLSAGIPINATAHSNLTWLGTEIPTSIGILIAGTGKWDDGTPNLVVGPMQAFIWLSPLSMQEMASFINCRSVLPMSRLTFSSWNWW
jgi:hypothetical protein